MKPLTPEDVIQMFKNCPINEKGEYSFHDMQNIIMNERITRLRQMCMMPCDRGAEVIMKLLQRKSKNTFCESLKWNALKSFFNFLV